MPCTATNPKSKLPKIIHPIAGGMAMLLISLFITSTVLVEIFGDPQMIATVKRSILYGVALLIPLMAITGGSGFRMIKKTPKKGVIAAKAKRMKFIAANGILILVPCAIFLDQMAKAGDYGSLFTAIQTLELVAGPLNLILMGLNMRDGLALTRNRRCGRV